jgi:hypothetical protein
MLDTGNAKEKFPVKVNPPHPILQSNPRLTRLPLPDPGTTGPEVTTPEITNLEILRPPPLLLKHQTLLLSWVRMVS